MSPPVQTERTLNDECLDAREDADRLAKVVELLRNSCESPDAMHIVMLPAFGITVGDIVDGALALHEVAVASREIDP